MPTDPLQSLADTIRAGLSGPEGGIKPLLEALFGERYQQRHFEKTLMRDAYALAGEGDSKVPYAGLIHPDNPPSGPYGGTSTVWFPSAEHGSLIDFGVGTRGLPPDEGILTRPGHRRRIGALRRYLARLGVEAWSKPDPSALGISVPKVVRDRFPGFEAVFKRYGAELYCAAKVPQDDPDKARLVVQAFLDLYARERGWKVLAKHQAEYNDFHAQLDSDLFPTVEGKTVNDLLRTRRFVILQGPPGTGKTRLAEQIRRQFFDGHGTTVQFHPAVTYEDFIVGLSPDPSEGQLRFGVRPGWLLDAARQAQGAPFLLVIDEVNRADLGKVLGEAIYLFEADEVGGQDAREVQLAHEVALTEGAKPTSRFRLPDNLYVLGTMNTADKSIANIDLAVRRRFAFVTLRPDRAVVAAQGLELATSTFDRITDVFVEHAPEEALDLLPGHAYYLASSDEHLRKRLRYELLPLLDEYLSQGFLGPAGSELHAVRDSIEDELQNHGR